MKVFNNLEEMDPYYNEHTNTYEFIENQKMIDVEFDFNLNTDRNIKAGNIDANYITAGDIDARDIESWNINASNIKSNDIKASNIKASNIKAWDIDARDIEAWDIDACNINASDIKANDIKASDINACNIEFYAICFSYKTFVCNTIKGSRKNAKYFCLDSDVVINQNM